MNKFIRFLRYPKYCFSEAWFDFKCRCYAFKHGHRYSDTWNMNYWFIDNAIPILDSMIEHGIGCPADFLGEWDEDTNDYKGREDGGDPWGAWKEVLTEMRDGFQYFKDIRDMVGYDELRKSYGFGEVEFKFEPIGDGTLSKLINPDQEKDPNKYMDFLEEWWAIEEESNKRLDKSLGLFKKHFLDLWD